MPETLDKICQRAVSYKFLSECYYLPDEELAGKVAEFAQVNQFFAELCSGDSLESELESLKIDYTQLFVGPFKLLAPPYGSFYLEDGKMMGDSTIDVRDWYEREGLDIVIKDVPDHIAMELEFMHYLAVKEGQGVEQGNIQDAEQYQHKQKSFLGVHLSRWLPKFAENVQENAQTNFYRKLASLTDVFVQRDLDESLPVDSPSSSLISG